MDEQIDDLFRSWPRTKVVYLPSLRAYGYCKKDLGFELTEEELEWFWSLFEVAKRSKLQIHGPARVLDTPTLYYRLERTGLKTYYVELQKK